MNLPFGMQMGAGLGRKKRDNTIAGFDVVSPKNRFFHISLSPDSSKQPSSRLHNYFSNEYYPIRPRNRV
jgi:hypothetical protein